MLIAKNYFKWVTVYPFAQISQACIIPHTCTGNVPIISFDSVFCNVINNQLLVYCEEDCKDFHDDLYYFFKRFLIS